MGEHAQELVLPAVRVAELPLRLLQLLHALLEQVRLAVELQEHVDLAPEDALVERLVEEVDAAGLVAAEHPAREWDPP